MKIRNLSLSSFPRDHKWVVLFCLFLLLVSAVPAFTQVNGAIFTTISDGTTINGNIYHAKTSVYLNGGPQNKNGAVISPDGNYYFQVTDPSGRVLLSADSIHCREVVVSGGRVTGVPSSTPSGCISGLHPLGTWNSSNLGTPVQLCPPTSSSRSDNLGGGSNFDAHNWCDFTPNNGGEYKAWLTPVGSYDAANCPNFGFCDSASKTDNFKVRNGNAAYITVCKFNDLDADGVRGSGEPFLPGWPITATGVDDSSGSIGTVNAQTDANGCISFSVSDFKGNSKGQVAITEGSLAGAWRQTAPAAGAYTVQDGAVPAGTVTVTVTPRNTQSLVVAAGQSVTLDNFGNTCLDSTCGGNTVELTVTEDANPSLTRTYTWGITKSVDSHTVYSPNGGTSNPANYIVAVSHDSGIDSGWQVTGTIKITNPSWVDLGGVDVAETVSAGGVCKVTNGSAITIPAKSTVNVPYACTYSSLPASGIGTATVTWNSGGTTPGNITAPASFNFANPAITVVDGSVTVTDKLDNATAATLGTASYFGANPTTFAYARTFNDAGSACTIHSNTATFTTNTTGTKGSAGTTVQNCHSVTIACAHIATGEVGVAFDSGALTVTGGTAPYTYSIVGTLPAGLTLNTSTGAVSGMPMAAGSFSVQVTDATGATGTACPITITASSSNCTLGVANAFNLIALSGDINDSADITGRIAASGRVTQSTTIGSDLRISDPFLDLASQNGGPWAIVAAGGIPASNSFNIDGGGNVYSSTLTSAGFNFANENYPGSLYMGSQLVTGGTSPIDFSALQTSMYNLSGKLAGLAANGSICTVDNFGSMVAGNGCPSHPLYFNPSAQHYNPSWLVLYGTNTTANVFNISKADFEGNKNLDIEVPTGSTAIINVAGTSDTLQRDIYFQGNTVATENAGSILFNFANATSVTLNGQIDAFALAPQAYLSGGSQMGGIFIAAGIGPTGEVHYYPFGGHLPIPCSQQSTPQTINFNLSGPVTFGVAPITLSAEATSALPVSFNIVSGPASVNGFTLTINGAGTVVVAANQAGNSTYAAAPQVTQTLVVNRATPAITWATPGPIAYGTALDGTQLNATASVPGTFVYDPAAGTIPPIGIDTLKVTFTPADIANYTTATATVALVVNSVSNSQPVISGMSPLYTAAGGPAITLTVNGTGFTGSSIVYLGATGLTTQFVSATQLTATLPAALTATAGVVSDVTVQSPGGGISNAVKFEVDSPGTGGGAPPTASAQAVTVSAGATATYLVILPTSASNVTLNCLNLPAGATCAYSASAGTVTIATSAATARGTYQITLVFTETLPGAAPSFVVLPFLLLPLLRRKLEKKGIWLPICLLIALAIGVGAMSGCGGGGPIEAPVQNQTHQVHVSGSVSLTVK